MIRRWPLLAVALVLPSCASNDPPDEGGAAEVPGTRVIVVAEDGTRAEVHRPVTPAHLAGSYHVGDGTAYNMLLSLNVNGTFDGTVCGCLGVFGTATGRWAIDPEGLAFDTTRADGMLQEKPLGRMRLVTLQGHYLLVQEWLLDLFEKYGPTTGSCLHQKAAEAAIEAEWARSLCDRIRCADQPVDNAKNARTVK